MNISGHLQNKIFKAFVYVILIVGAFIVLIPFFWMISSSLKNRAEVFLFPPKWIPYPPKWDNYSEAVTVLPFFLYFKNTCIITFTAMLGIILSCSLVAYGFARLRFPGRDFFFLLVLATLILPPEITIIPLFIMFKEFGWVDTFKSLTIPAFFGNAFFVFLLRQFFMTIPVEIEDAARIDGCNTFQVFCRITLPQVKPALAAVAIFSFLFTWNDFLRPLIFLSSTEKFTLSLGLNSFLGMRVTEWNVMMAFSLLILFPCILIFLFAQKYFIKGIVLTGIKG